MATALKNSKLKKANPSGLAQATGAPSWISHDFYFGDNVLVAAAIEGADLIVGRLYKATPEVIQVAFPIETPNLNTIEGKACAVTIDVSAGNKPAPGFVINLNLGSHAGEQLAIATINFTKIEYSTPRKSANFGDKSQLLAFSKSGLQFKTIASFKLVKIARNQIEFISAKQDSLLFPGMKLDVDLFIQDEAFTVPMIIDWIERDADDHIRVKCHYAGIPDPGFINKMAIYTLGHVDNFTIMEIRRIFGTKLHDLDTAFTVSYATSSEDFHQVLELRRLVAVSEERVPETATAEEFEDRFDAVSRQIVVKVRNRVVGAARLVFIEGKAERSEIAAFIELPQKMLDESTVEFTRLAVHPSFRGREVFLAILKHVLRIAITANVKNIMGDCRLFLKGDYKSLGATDLNISFPHPLYPNEHLHLMNFDVLKCTKRPVGNIQVYASIFLPILQYCAERGYFRENYLFRLTFRLKMFAAHGHLFFEYLRRLLF